jgi:hypothetical protein
VVVVLLVLLVLLVPATRAPAVAATQEDPETLIKQGVELRRRHDDLRAEGYFRRAYNIARTPRSAAQLGLVEMALKSYAETERYLSEALSTPDGWIDAHRQTIEETLKAARTHLLGVELTGAPADASVTLPGREAVKLPADGKLWLVPGASSVRVEAAGRTSVVVDVSGAAGEMKRVPIKMSVEPSLRAAVTAPPATVPAPAEAAPVATAVAPAARPEAAAPGSALRVAGIVVGAVGVGAAVAGAVVTSMGLSKKQHIEQASTTGTRYDPSDGNWESLRNAGIGLLVAGGVAAAGGVTLYLVGLHEGRSASGAPEESHGAAVSFSAGPGFGWLALRGSF